MVVRDAGFAKECAKAGRICVTAGVLRECGITKFSKRLSVALRETGSRAIPVDPRFASEFRDRVIINFEHGVMSRRRALKLARKAKRAVAILHTIRRDEDKRFVKALNEEAHTVAMHPYASDYVDEVILHPATTEEEDVAVPERVTALGVFGLIRPGKGIEAALKLAAELGLDVYVRGEAQKPELVDSLKELADMLGVGLEIDAQGWHWIHLRRKVEDGVLPVVPSMATSFRSIWASGTEADLLGARVPYISYPALGGHNPCAYAIEFGGPSYISLFTEGVDAAAERAAKFVKRAKPVEWRDFAATVLQMLE